MFCGRLDFEICCFDLSSTLVFFGSYTISILLTCSIRFTHIAVGETARKTPAVGEIHASQAWYVEDLKTNQDIATSSKLIDPDDCATF